MPTVQDYARFGVIDPTVLRAVFVGAALAIVAPPTTPHDPPVGEDFLDMLSLAQIAIAGDSLRQMPLLTSQQQNVVQALLDILEQEVIDLRDDWQSLGFSQSS